MIARTLFPEVNRNVIKNQTFVCIVDIKETFCIIVGVFVVIIDHLNDIHEYLIDANDIKMPNSIQCLVFKSNIQTILNI